MSSYSRHKIIATHFIYIPCFAFFALMYQPNRSFNIPPNLRSGVPINKGTPDRRLHPPRAFEYLDTFCSNPPPRAEKLFKLVIEPRKLLFILQKQF